MSVIRILPHQTLETALRLRDRFGLQFEYGKGKVTAKCRDCREPIIKGRCGCPPVRA